MTSSASESDRWIRRFVPGPEAGARLICLPHAGGSASYYFSLSQALAPRIEVLAVQYPGRQDRRKEPFIDNIPELADKIYEALAPWSDRPFAFFGHSMGAVVALEVARRMRDGRGLSPVRLFASGRRAPNRYRQETVHLGSDPELVAELRRVGGTDPHWLENGELLATILPATRNDYYAIGTYVCAPAPPLDCPVSALVGDSDPQTTIDEAQAWREFGSRGFDLRVFPGGHFYLEACKAEVIEVITSALAQPAQHG
jgi:surfactin synthase thioesterase subunit